MRWLWLVLLTLLAPELQAVAPAGPLEPLVPQGETYEVVRPLLDKMSRASSMTAIAFSPDGKTLASGSDDNTVRVWDLASGRERARLEGHQSSVLSVAFSPDGHQNTVLSVAFSPDGKALASCSTDKIVRLWDLASGRERTRLEGHQSTVNSVAFSPDGKTLASGSDDNTVRLWDVASGRERARLEGHQDWVVSVAFSPDGKTLASGSRDKTVRLWDLASGRERARLEGHQNMVLAVAFSPDGKTLASGSTDKTVRLWDLANERERATLEGHQELVRWVAFSPDGKTLASSSMDKTVRLWDLASGRERGRLEGHQSYVFSVAFSPDGKTLASGSIDKTVRLWDLASGRERARLKHHQDWVTSVAISPDGKTLASGSDDKTVRLWDLASGRERARLEGHQNLVRSVAFSPDGKTLASGSDDKTVRLWDLASGRERARLEGQSFVLSVAFSPDGKTLAGCSTDKIVRLWDVASGRERAGLEGHQSTVNSVAFSPDGKTLASASDDHTVRLWDVASGRERARLEGHQSTVKSVAFSPDGKALASGSDDKSVRLWDLASGRERARLEGHQSLVYSVAFSPDGRTLASGSDDKTVRLWDLASGRERARLEGHQNSVNSVAFSPDGKTLASGSNTARIWLVESAKESTTLASGNGGTWVGCMVATGHCVRVDDGTLVVDVDASGRVQPLRPPGAHQALDVAVDNVAPLSVAAGQVLEIPIRVRNKGAGRAFWLGLVTPDTVEDRSWTLEPMVLQYLDPGKTATLTARVHLHTARINPAPVESELRLAVTQAFGDPIPVAPIRVKADPPALQLREAQWLRAQDTQAIVLTVENAGSPLAKAAFQIDIPGLEASPAPAELPQNGLARGGNAVLTFGLPAEFKPPKDLKVSLRGQNLRASDGTGLPLYDWEFKDVSVALPGLPWMVYLAVAIGLIALTAWLYYQRVYRHPAVVRLTVQPNALRDLDPGELSATSRLLKRAGRLEAVLNAASVHDSWLARAIAFDALPGSPERACAFTERLGRSCEGPIDSDATRWVVSLGEDFPLNLQRLWLCLPSPSAAPQDVLNALGTPVEVTLVLGAEPQQRRELAKLARSRSGLLVAPDGSELTALLLAQEPVDALARLIARYVPVTQISPYQTGAGVHKQSLFFGRGALIAQVMGREPANYLVVGGRQVGKSSLVKEIKRRYDNDPKVDCYYLVLSGQEAVGRLAEALGLAAGSGLDSVLDYLRGPRERRALLILDEADAFLQQDKQQNYAILQRLRALSEEGRAHFVLAGFWALYRQAALDYQSPLKNFGTVVTVGALERDACRALAVEPMQRLGIRWDSEELVTRLIDQTGQRANLISIACDEALYTLGQAERVIGAEHLKQVLAGNRVRDALLGWGDLGGDALESRLDRIVVYTTAPVGRFNLADLIKLLEQRGYSPEPEEIKNSLARLELAFVLAREGNQYFYQVPLQRELILADDTELLLRGELRAA